MGSALSSFKEQRKEKKELKRYLNQTQSCGSFSTVS